MPGVFICYRREDSSGWTGRIYDRAAERLGQNRVFMDIEAIRVGEDFTSVINEVLDETEAMVVVIGPRWLNVRDDEGQLRLSDPSDYVGQEILGALKRGMRVVPVLVEGAAMPEEHDLPRPLRPLAHRNALEVSDLRFDHDIGQLLDALTVTSPRRRAWLVPTSVVLGLSAVLIGGLAAMSRQADGSEESVVEPAGTILVDPVGAPSSITPELTSTTTAPKGVSDVLDSQGRSFDDWWPTFGGDLERTGIADATGLPDGPTGYYWRVPLGGAVGSSPILHGRTVIAGGTSHLHFIDAASGEARSVPVGGAVNSTPTIVDDTVYLGTDLGWIYGVSALEAHEAPERWRFQTGGAVTGSPVVVDLVVDTVVTCPSGGTCVVGDIVIVGSADGYVYAINSRDRGLIDAPFWQFPVAADSPVAPFTSSPALWGDFVFIGSSEGYVYKINTLNGTGELCARVVAPISYLVAADGIVHVGSGFETLFGPRWSDPSITLPRQSPYGGFDSYDAETCEWLLSTAVSGTPRGAAIDTTENLKLVTSGGFLEAFPIGESEYAWFPHLVPGVPSSAPVVAGGIAYFGSEDGGLHAVDVATGASVWEYKLEGPIRSTPVPGDRVLYVIDGAGTLHALSSH